MEQQMDMKVICVRCKKTVQEIAAIFVKGTCLFNPYYVCHVCCNDKH